MNARNMPSQAFVAVTIIAVLAVTTVFMVYAVLLKSYTGGIVTIQAIGGSIQYSVENSTLVTWTSTLNQSASAEWYARIEITNSPSQDVTVAWTLQSNATGSWMPVTTDFATMTMTLTPSTAYIYASTNGLINGNHNWGDHTTSEGFYRLTAEMNTA